jgi:hypothetical protein
VALVAEPDYFGKQEVLNASCICRAEVVVPLFGACGDWSVEEGGAFPVSPANLIGVKTLEHLFLERLVEEAADVT